MTLDILVLRHGETEWNAIGRMQGHKNSGLTEAGRAQALRQGEILRGLDWQARRIFVSPQGRALETARLAMPQAEDHFIQDPRLMEIDIGAWSGGIKDDLRAQSPEKFASDYLFDWYDHAPGGEGFAGLEARCRSFLRDLSGPAILFTHGITSRMLRVLAMGKTTADLTVVPGGQGLIHHVDKNNHKTLR